MQYRALGNISKTNNIDIGEPATISSLSIQLRLIGKASKQRGKSYLVVLLTQNVDRERMKIFAKIVKLGYDGVPVNSLELVDALSWFIAASDGIKHRETVRQATSTLTGSITVEDVIYENNDEEISRLFPSKDLMFHRLFP